MKRRILSVSLLIFLVCSWGQATTQGISSPYPVIYKNLRFWDHDLNECFFDQETDYSCVPASVQMVLKYLDFSPLPNQTTLASEMHTDIYHTTQWEYTYIPFDNRGFYEYYIGSLSENFDQALSNLRGNVSQNFPAIVNMWYDEEAKLEKIMTHARVVTGYNSSGIFLHDPWSGPNQFFDNSAFSSLWETDLGFWALIIKLQPSFNLLIKVSDVFGPLPGVEVMLKNEINETKFTNSNGEATFSNISISNYILTYNWKLGSEEESLTITKTTTGSYTVIFSVRVVVLIAIVFLIILVGIIICAKRRRSEFS